MSYGYRDPRDEIAEYEQKLAYRVAADAAAADDYDPYAGMEDWG